MEETIEIPEELCRLCLVREDVEVCIFDNMSLDDCLPKKICNRCSAKLDVCYEFVNTTLEAQKQLVSWLGSLTECNAGSDPARAHQLPINKQELLDSVAQNGSSCHSIHQLPDNCITNSVNEQQSQSEVPSVTAIKSGTDSDDKPLLLPVEEKDKVQRQATNKRRRKRREDVSTQQKSSRKNVQHSTPIRGRKKSKRKGTNGRSQNDGEALEATVSCEVCNLRCNSAVTLALHSSEHSPDKKYTCPVCQYQTVSRHVMRTHTKIHVGSSKFKCEVCQKSFGDSTRAKEHKNLHTGEKPFQCEICGKSFTFSLGLADHRQTQHWEAIHGTPMVKFDCTICNKHYTCHSGLRRHRLNKHPSADQQSTDRSVLCDTCGKRLSSRDKLRMHLRIHTGYKPFACEICPKAFTCSEQLRVHERTHTGEKPHVCPDCGRAFSQRGPLRIHQRSHTGERPYVCRTCGKGFVSKAAMDSHSRCCSTTLDIGVLM